MLKRSSLLIVTAIWAAASPVRAAHAQVTSQFIPVDQSDNENWFTHKFALWTSASTVAGMSLFYAMTHSGEHRPHHYMDHGNDPRDEPRTPPKDNGPPDNQNPTSNDPIFGDQPTDTTFTNSGDDGNPVTTTPEPATLALTGLGLSAVAAMRRRRRKTS